MIYVMSDIHGDMDRFRSVMEQIKLTAADHLYVLGDVVDRQPYGIQILLELMRMPNATVLLGNHELMMEQSLREHSRWKFMKVWYGNGGLVTHNAYCDLHEAEQNALLQYIDDMPIMAEVTVDSREYLLVHGKPPQMKYTDGNQSVSDREYAVWARIYAEDRMPEGKTVVFGHTPTEYYQDGAPLRIWDGGDKIGIDCGCGNDSFACRLSCLRLDDMAEFYSK